MATKTTKRLIDRLREADGWNASTRYPFDLKDSKGNLIETIYFRPITKSLRKKIVAMMNPKDGVSQSNPDFYDYNTYLLIQNAELVDGSKAFDMGDFDALSREINTRFLDELEEFMVNAGLKTVEEEKKTSDPTPTDDSPSS